MNIHVRIQLCAFKLMATLAQQPDIDRSIQTLIIDKLLQVIDHDDARVRAEALRTIVNLFCFYESFDQKIKHDSFLDHT